eukprot:14348591-Alexandrium_andersonii.AAC.1
MELSRTLRSSRLHMMEPCKAPSNGALQSSPEPCKAAYNGALRGSGAPKADLGHVTSLICAVQCPFFPGAH